MDDVCDGGRWTRDCLLRLDSGRVIGLRLQKVVFRQMVDALDLEVRSGMIAAPQDPVKVVEVHLALPGVNPGFPRLMRLQCTHLEQVQVD